MANRKITELNKILTSLDEDLLIIEQTNGTKAITKSNLLKEVNLDLEDKVNFTIDNTNNLEIPSVDEKLDIVNANYNEIKQTIDANEANKNNSENIRINNETTRISNEVTRVSSENTRVANETARINAEVTRGTKETARVNAENIRIANENARIESFNTIKADNDIFKSNVNAKTGDIEIGYFDKKQYPNGKDRLDFDFEYVNRRLNEAELLGYESPFMKCDSTYQGLTSDILIKGRTLQNLIDVPLYNGTYTSSGVEIARVEYSSPYHIINITNDGDCRFNLTTDELKLLKPSTKYTFIINVKENSCSGDLRCNSVPGCIFTNNGVQSMVLFCNAKQTGLFKWCYQSEIDVAYRHIPIKIAGCKSGEILKYQILILEGDYTNINFPIEYFEGIKSSGETELMGDKYKINIESHGKNLFDGNLESGRYTMNNGKAFVDNNCLRSVNPIKVKPNTTYFVKTYPSTNLYNISEYNNGAFVNNISATTNFIKFTTTNNTTEVNISLNSPDLSTKIQLEENTITTSYEDYIKDAKYILLDEPLRSLPNGVCDTVNELGVVTRRIGKVVLDGSENWKVSSSPWTSNGYYAFGFTVQNNGVSNFNTINVISDRFKGLTNTDSQKDNVGIFLYDSYGKSICIKQQIATNLEEFKTLLSQNPTTVYYELAIPIVTDYKKNMNLKTYEGVTYILNTNTLPSEISCKVPSNVQAVVMNLINENQELNNTVSLMSLENEESNLSNIETSLEQDVRLTMLELGL